jgi:hypothetical protein
MDVVLRKLHDTLVAEFICTSTELRIVKTGAGEQYPRTIQPFCTDSRAQSFGQILESFEETCAPCPYLQRRQERTGPGDPVAAGV